jgi:hypothetical protein
MGGSVPSLPLFHGRDKPEKFRLPDAIAVMLGRSSGMVGMGMIKADDGIVASLQLTHQCQPQARIHFETAAGIHPLRFTRYIRGYFGAVNRDGASTTRPH